MILVVRQQKAENSTREAVQFKGSTLEWECKLAAENNTCIVIDLRFLQWLVDAVMIKFNVIWQSSFV